MGETHPYVTLVPTPQRRRSRWPLHLALFLISFVTCTMAGAAWRMRDPSDVANWSFGLTYATLILVFLASHEFGHYVAARIHKVDATLPFFIPLPLVFAPSFGTMGAVIRTRSPIPSRRAMFDIGVAGPIAGFIVCCGILAWGLTHLPPKEYLYGIHPELRALPHLLPYGLTFGPTLMYEAFAGVFVPAGAFLPPMNEIYHYPFLCVGWFGMFVTALNLIPVGQLDGGHLTFGMFGDRHGVISRTTFYLLLAFGLFGVYDFFAESGFVHTGPLYIGWSGWLFWAIFVRLVIRLGHPPVADMTPLNAKRRLVGWATIGMFLLCFSPRGIYEVPPPAAGASPAHDPDVTVMAGGMDAPGIAARAQTPSSSPINHVAISRRAIHALGQGGPRPPRVQSRAIRHRATPVDAGARRVRGRRRARGEQLRRVPGTARIDRAALRRG